MQVSVPRPHLLLQYRRVNVIDNLHLNATLGNIRAQVHRTVGLFKGKPMGHQLLEVQDSATEASDARRPSVSVPVYEAEVNLEKVSVILISMGFIGVDPYLC